MSIHLRAYVTSINYWGKTFIILLSLNYLLYLENIYQTIIIEVNPNEKRLSIVSITKKKIWYQQANIWENTLFIFNILLVFNWKACLKENLSDVI